MTTMDKLKGEVSNENGEAAFPWHTRWAGCTYELAEQRVPGLDPLPVLRPIPNSDVRWFDPIAYPSHAVPRAPEDRHTTPYEALARLDLSNHDEILRFVNQWGLLGLWDVQEYADWEPFLWEAHEKAARALTTGQEPGIFSQAWYERQRRRERWFGRAGWANRQEPLPVFQVAAWHYQEWVRKIESFGELSTVKERQEATYEITYGFELGECPYTSWAGNVPERAPGFSLLLGGDVQPRLVWDEGRRRWVFGWQYRSLLHAIYFATFLTMAEGDASGGFRRCANERCGRLFIARRRNARFCSKLCEKAQTMRNLRARSSKEGGTHAR